MSKIQQFMQMLEDKTSVDNKPVPTQSLVDAFLPMNMELITANQLLQEIQTKYGKEVGKDFIDFVLKKGFPQHKDLLIEFFKAKNDIFSRQYLLVLEAKN